MSNEEGRFIGAILLGLLIVFLAAVFTWVEYQAWRERRRDRRD